MSKMDKFIQDLHCQNVEEISKCLNTFCNEHVRTMEFDELSEDNMRCEIWRLLFEKLTDERYIAVREKCLETLRILSRDKKDLDNLITDERLSIIINNAKISTLITSYTNVTLEAIKLICNLIYNSTSVQIQIVNTPCLLNLVNRINSYNNSTPSDMKLFDVRILFLVTAFNTTSRNILKYQLNADSNLIDMLESLFNRIDQDTEKKHVEVASEILKTLFNLYIECDDSANDNKQKYDKLINIIYELLIKNNFNGKEELENHVINLLTVMPSNCYGPIIKPAINIKEHKNEKIFSNVDMSAISELLRFLDYRLSNSSNVLENILPILSALLRLVSHERLIRKYCREEILPPLKDVMTRPEEGTTLRAKLCKFLVSPYTELKNLVAEFLFILCKENVDRMIKYTGYGNAAGMFADKGLLGCKQRQTDYSSDSCESDTEEYCKYKEDINPVTGCYEKSKPNPLEGMSDEQKEYEAMKLVKLVNQLTNDGIVRPCTIGEDGKPKPVEHILELQDGLQHGLRVNHNSDSE